MEAKDWLVGFLMSAVVGLFVYGIGYGAVAYNHSLQVECESSGGNLYLINEKKCVKVETIKPMKSIRQVQ
jgi:hypothetical protein